MAWVQDDPVYEAGDRVVTSDRLTIMEQEGLEELGEMLANQTGTVVDTKVYDIVVDGDEGNPIKLPACRVELDGLIGHPITFHPDELRPEDQP